MAAEEPIVTREQYQMLASFRYALRRFLRFSEEAALGAGITPQQHQALLAIKGFPDRDMITVGELAERLQILHHSAVGLANRLVAMKLARRERNPEDRRQVYLRLTKQGESILAQLSAAHHDQLRRIGPEIKAVLARLTGEAER